MMWYQNGKSEERIMFLMSEALSRRNFQSSERRVKYVFFTLAAIHIVVYFVLQFTFNVKYVSKDLTLMID